MYVTYIINTLKQQGDYFLKKYVLVLIIIKFIFWYLDYITQNFRYMSENKFNYKISLCTVKKDFKILWLDVECAIYWFSAENVNVVISFRLYYLYIKCLLFQSFLSPPRTSLPYSLPPLIHLRSLHSNPSFCGLSKFCKNETFNRPPLVFY